MSSIRHKVIIEIFFKYEPNPYRLISSFSQHNHKNSTKFEYKSIDSDLGIRTLDPRMVGADESTKLLQPPLL